MEFLACKNSSKLIKKPTKFKQETNNFQTKLQI
jgi:hypothetical protein